MSAILTALAAALTSLVALVGSLSSQVAIQSVPPTALTAQVAATSGAVLQVGPSRTYKNPADAAAVAKDGDTIEIDAGTYQNQLICVSVANLTIRGVGGRAHLANGIAGVPSVKSSNGSWCQDKGIIVTDDTSLNLTVENLELSGAKSSAGNGAGIRHQGGDLTVLNSYFHHNEDGILGGTALSHVDIENSEFAFNGAGDGQSHNIYISHVNTLTFKNNYSHDSKVGHLLKTRATTNYIIGNRISDEAGTGSYDMDINGGRAYVIGNVIEKGPNTSNSSQSIYFYNDKLAGAANGTAEIYVINNTFVSYAKVSQFINLFEVDVDHPESATVVNNIFIGAAPKNGVIHTSRTAPDLRNNISLPLATTDLVDLAGFDYHLSASSAAINAGVNPGVSSTGYNLTPQLEYVHPSGGKARVVSGSALDIGAFEFTGTPIVTLNPPIVSFTSAQSLSDTSSTLTWSSNAASCTASGAWSGSKSSAGTFNTGPMNSSATYTLTCTNAAGPTTQSIVVKPPAPPTLTFSAVKTNIPSGTGTFLLWTATNASTCTASGKWNGAIALSGAYETGPLTSGTTYTLSCTGLSGGSAVKSVTITPSAQLSGTSGPVTFEASAEPSELPSSANNTGYTAKVGPAGTLVVKNSGQVNLVATPTGRGIYFGPGGQQSANAAYLQFPLSSAQYKTIFNENGGEIVASMVSGFDLASRPKMTAQNNTHRMQTVVQAEDGTNIVARLGYDLWSGIELRAQAPGALATEAIDAWLPSGVEDLVMGNGKPFILRLTWDGTTERLFINSVLLAEQVYTKTPIVWGTTSNMTVGASVDAKYIGFTPILEPLDDLQIIKSTGAQSNLPQSTTTQLPPPGVTPTLPPPVVVTPPVIPIQQPVTPETPVPVLPVVPISTFPAEITLTPSTIRAGESSILAWNSTNMLSCVVQGAEGSWAGTSGSVTVSPWSSSSYSLTCNSSVGSNTKYAQLTVTSSSLSNTAQSVSFTRTLKQGASGEDVRTLQRYLNTQGFPVVPSGQETTYFGPATAAALVRFQELHRDQILTPSGLTSGTGILGPKTISIITGKMLAPSSIISSVPVISTRVVKLGFSGADIVALQSALIARGYLAPGSATGYFGPLTRSAVRTLQCDKGIMCNGDEISTGWGLVGSQTWALIR